MDMGRSSWLEERGPRKEGSAVGGTVRKLTIVKIREWSSRDKTIRKKLEIENQRGPKRKRCNVISLPKRNLSSSRRSANETGS